MENSKIFKLGFLHFKEEAGDVTLYRIGTYFASDMPNSRPRSAGFFHIRTAEKCYEGSGFVFTGAQQNGNEVKLNFETICHSLRVTAIFHRDEESGIISRKDVLENCSGKTLHILRFSSRLSFQCGDYEIYSQQSRWGLENQGAWNRIHAGAVELGSRRGRWTESGTPFAVIRSDEAPRAIAFHLLPDGDYSMKFSLPGFSTFKCPLVLETGLDDERLDHPLSPGETLHGMELLIQELPDRNAHSGTAALHRYAGKHLVRNHRTLPVLYNTWLDKMSDLTIPRLRRQLTAAGKIGCELFVIDAGWYNALGDWTEITDKAFAGKMREFREEVRRAGLKFGIWIEPEFFSANAPVVTAHPEWFAPGEVSGGAVRMNFSCPEAAEYYYSVITGLIKKYDLDYIKIDMNSSPGPDDSGRALAHYVESVRKIMARIRENFPAVILENCSSGAMRTTLAELPWFDHHFISDNGNVLDVLHITQGMLLRFPPGKLLRWLVIASGGENQLWGRNESETILQVQNATWKHYEETDLECGLIAAMTGVMGFSGDLASFREETLQKIRVCTDYYIANRDSIQRSVGTLLTPPCSIDHRHGIIALQLSDPVTDKHFVFAFYRNCDGISGAVFPLHELSREKSYLAREVSFSASASPGSGKFTGAELEDNGLELRLESEQHGDFKASLWEISPA